MKLDVNFPVYSYKKKTKKFSQYINEATYLSNELLQLEENINIIRHSLDSAYRKADLYIQNINENTRQVSVLRHFFTWDEDTLCVYDLKTLDDVSLNLELSGIAVDEDVILDNLPPTSMQFKFTRKQHIHCDELIQEYMLRYDIMESYVEQYQEYQTYHDKIMNDIQHQLKNCTIINVSDYSVEVEPFNEEEHAILAINIDNEEDYDIIYVKKEYKDKLLKYMQKITK
jgi:L-rhamnose mutarotase